MGKKLDRFMRGIGIPEESYWWDDPDEAEAEDIDRVVFVKCDHTNEDWELWKVNGVWSIQSHGMAMGPWAT